MLTDTPGQTSGKAEELFRPVSKQQEYCISPLCVDKDGTIYYKNDSCYLNVWFSVISFIKGLGCDTNEMESADTEEVLAESGKNMESAIAYAKKMISQAIEIRDQNSGNKNRSILKTAVDFIDSHYMDEEISLNTVANVANVSSNHFSALFSQNMGQTFIEYLTSLRMNKAKELLRCTGMRSSEIAGEIGYKDAHYFSYLFKKTQGMTPSDYRKEREEKA